jgi:hypothetical protein
MASRVLRMRNGAIVHIAENRRRVAPEVLEWCYLRDAQQAYNEQYRFADVFVRARRVPRATERAVALGSARRDASTRPPR